MTDLRVRKLQWLCRRGMKELDVLLERFVRDEESRLARGEWPEFEALLATEDDRLWDWVQRPDDPAAASWRPLLERIRDGAENPC